MEYKLRMLFISVGIVFFFSNSWAQDQKVCDDLFSATCLGPNGRNKFAERNEKTKEGAVKVVRDARDKTAKELGFKDFDEALKSRLKEAGFELKNPPDEKTWKLLKGEIESDGSYDSNEAKRLYVSAELCDKDVDELKKISYYGITDLNELKKVQDQVDNFWNKYNGKATKIHSNDIPDFISNYIGDKCKRLKNDPDHYKPEENPEAAKVCGNIEQLRREAVRIFRLEGTPEYQVESEKFIRENLIPDLSYHSPPSASTTTNPPPEKSEVDKARDQIQKTLNRTYSYCYSYSEAIKKSAKKVAEDFMKEINTSKTTVESVIGAFYTDENKKKANEMFVTAKTDIQDMITKFVKDPQKRTEIMNGYDSLNLLWMENPPDSSYKKGPRGNLVLDDQKAVPSYVRQFSDDPLNVFADPTLSHFTTMNANYVPVLSMGRYNQKERVAMMPVFIQNMKDNPYVFQTVLAHEAGHKIGPLVSRINGYDLTPEYKELLACYKDNKSIKLEENQADETIADYISSEVMARQISKLPKEQRQSALMSSMEAFCQFDVTMTHMHTVMCKGAHPENSLRISGVYGANPNMRKAIGCEGDSPNFKSCGLKDIKLPEISNSSRATVDSDANAARGTR